MVVTRLASQLIFAGSMLFLTSPAYAEKLERDIALAPLRELLATTDIQQQVLNDRRDPAFKDSTENFSDNVEFVFEKTFLSENWDISLRSIRRRDGVFQKTMYLGVPSGDEYNEGASPTFCQEVNSLLMSELGQPNVILDTSSPLATENVPMSITHLRSTWHHQGLGIASTCIAIHHYMAFEEAQITTRPAFAGVIVTDIDNMETIQALSPVTCSYQGTVRNAELPSGIEQDFTFDFYLNETDNEILSLEKTILASDVLFTDGEIFGVWEDEDFKREFRINRYSGTSTLFVQGLGEDSDLTYNSSSGECVAQIERKF